MIRIEQGDFRELSDGLADGSVDLVLTDPPYPEKFLPLWSDLARVSARVLAPGGFLVAYSGQMFLPEVMQRLGEHLRYYWTAFLHMRGPNVLVRNRTLGQQAKPILVYSKGKPNTHVYWTDYVLSPSRSKAYHKWGQSVAPFRQLTEWFSEPGDLILDPCLGGGTTAVACFQTNRDCIGYEIDAATADTARQRVATAQLPLAPQVMQAVQGALL